MKEGTVKFFNDSKGFGFIKETATGQEYFVHISGLLVDSLSENDSVTFELKEGKKGLNAVNVRLAIYLHKKLLEFLCLLYNLQKVKLLRLW